MTEKIREEFEAWAESHDWPIVIGSAGCYREIQVDAMWQAWQASRESLVIELPKGFGGVIFCDDTMEIGDVIKAIEAAGVKVK